MFQIEKSRTGFEPTTLGSEGRVTGTRPPILNGNSKDLLDDQEISSHIVCAQSEWSSFEDNFSNLINIQLISIKKKVKLRLRSFPLSRFSTDKNQQEHGYELEDLVT